MTQRTANQKNTSNNQQFITNCDSAHLNNFEKTTEYKKNNFFGGGVQTEQNGAFFDRSVGTVCSTVKVRTPKQKNATKQDPDFNPLDLTDLQRNALERQRLYDKKRGVVAILKNHHQAHPTNEYLADRFPTCSCRMSVRPMLDTADFWKNNKTGVVSTNDLITCKKAWVCPVCGGVLRAKKLERLELMSQNNSKIEFGRQHMMTLTIPHHAGLKLSQVVEEIRKVRSYFVRTKPLNDAKKRFGIRDFAWFAEIDLSKRSGWHVHYHVVVFTDEDFDETGFARWASSRWRTGIEKVIGVESYDDSFDLQSDFKKLGYVTKPPLYFEHLLKCRADDEWWQARLVELAELKGFAVASFGRNEWTKKLNEVIEKPKKGGRGYATGKKKGFTFVCSLDRAEFAKVRNDLAGFLSKLENVMPNETRSQNDDLYFHKVVLSVVGDNENIGFVDKSVRFVDKVQWWYIGEQTLLFGLK